MTHTTHRASQDYLREKRQWQEASDAEARAAADLQKQLAAERGGRDAAEALVATLQVGWGGVLGWWSVVDGQGLFVPS